MTIKIIQIREKNMSNEKKNIIIYNTIDGKASVSLYARDGTVWMNQNQMAELFDTSKQNIGQHVANILKEGELQENSVVKNYFTTAADGKQYRITFYSLDMFLAIGFRVRSKRSEKSMPNLTPAERPMKRIWRINRMLRR